MIVRLPFSKTSSADHRNVNCPGVAKVSERHTYSRTPTLLAIRHQVVARTAPSRLPCSASGYPAPFWCLRLSHATSLDTTACRSSKCLKFSLVPCWNTCSANSVFLSFLKFTLSDLPVSASLVSSAYAFRRSSSYLFSIPSFAMALSRSARTCVVTHAFGPISSCSFRSFPS